MSDRPSDAEQPSAKREKRGASRQLTKDDGDDSDGDEPVQMGTFQKASEEVMAGRRVIKARRPAGGAGQSAPPANTNPFAGVSLAAPTTGGNPFAGVKLAPPASGGDASAPPAAKGGWDPSFLAKAQAASKAATDAATEEIDKASGGAKQAAPPASAAAAVPVAGKWPAAFMSKAKESAEAATAAAAAEIDKASGADKPAAAPAPAAASAPSKWPAAFMAKTKEASEAATAAAQAEIDKSNKPAASGGFAFGAGTATGAAGGFSFAATQANAFALGGDKPKDAANEGGAGGFKFGGAAGAEGGFKFGGAALEGGFKFGGSASTSPEGAAPPAAGGGFKFGGDVGGGFPSLQSVFGDGGSPVGTVQLGGAAPAPAVKLSEVEAKTGEEDDEVVLNMDGTLYEFEASEDGAGQWKERGKGKMSVNLGKDGRARMVMRARGNLRLLLNACLWAEMQLSRMDGGKGVSFTVLNAAAPEKEGSEKKDKDADAGEAGSEGAVQEMGTYALRVKGEGRLDEFVQAIEKYKKGGEEEKIP